MSGPAREITTNTTAHPSHHQPNNHAHNQNNNRAIDRPFACFSDTRGVIVSTTNELPPSYRIVHVLGAVYGQTCRARNIAASMGAAFKSMIGGELRPLTKLLYSARDEATERMIGECVARGGNAILAMRYDITGLGDWVEVCAYGTAVLVAGV